MYRHTFYYHRGRGTVCSTLHLTVETEDKYNEKRDRPKAPGGGFHYVCAWIDEYQEAVNDDSVRGDNS